MLKGFLNLNLTLTHNLTPSCPLFVVCCLVELSDFLGALRVSAVKVFFDVFQCFSVLNTVFEFALPLALDFCRGDIESIILLYNRFNGFCFPVSKTVKTVYKISEHFPPRDKSRG